MNLSLEKQIENKAIEYFNQSFGIDDLFDILVFEESYYLEDGTTVVSGNKISGLIESRLKTLRQKKDEKKVDRFALLNNSRVLDVHRWSEYPEVKFIVDKVFDELIEVLDTQRLHRDKIKRHLRVVLCDLAYSWYEDGTCYVGYSRTKNDYSGPKRYNQLHIAYRPLIQVIDGLERLGYIENNRGFYNRDTKNGFQSRMKPTDKLIQVLKDGFVEYHMLGLVEDCETIYLNTKIDGKKVCLDYSDTVKTNQMRSEIQRLNNYFRDIVVSFDGKRLPIHFYRLFRNSFDEHGRIYCGSYQNRKSNERYKLKINGEQTAELDYSALHPTILYHQKGLNLPNEPYNIEGIDRNLVKHSLFVMINGMDKDTVVKGIQKKINFSGYSKQITPGTLMDLIAQKHKDISDCFNSGVGNKLMNIDSEIANSIMNGLMEQNIPCLSLHDSFIVQQANVDALMEQMKTNYRQRLGNEIDVKRKY